MFDALYIGATGMRGQQMQIVQVIDVVIQESRAVSEIRYLRQYGTINSNFYYIYVKWSNEIYFVLRPLERAVNDRFAK